MKKISIFFFLILICACSNSDDTNNSIAPSINPPSWIQGYWLRQVDATTGSVTDLQGIKAYNDDFYFTQLGSGNSMKALIASTVQSGGTAVVNEIITNSEYKLNITLNGMSYPQYYYKKSSSTKIQYFDTAGVGGAFFIKQ